MPETARLKPGTWNSLWVSHMWHKPRHLSHYLMHPRVHLTGSWNGEHRWDWNPGTQYEMQVSQVASAHSTNTIYRIEKHHIRTSVCLVILKMCFEDCCYLKTQRVHKVKTIFIIKLSCYLPFSLCWLCSDGAKNVRWKIEEWIMAVAQDCISNHVFITGRQLHLKKWS